MKVGFIEAIEHVDRENTALAKTLPLGTESLKEGEGVGNGRRGGGGLVLQRTWFRNVCSSQYEQHSSVPAHICTF